MQPVLEVIVVLGCRVHGRTPSAAAMRRVLRAVEAWRQHRGSRILVSGGRRWNGISEAEAFALALDEAGVDKSAIELESESLTTLENARYCTRWLEDREISALGLVTCDWHMRRALALFRRHGLDPRPLAAPSPRKPPIVRELRALREHLSYAWAAWMPAPAQQLARFLR